MREPVAGQNIRRVIRRTILRAFPSCKEIVKIISVSLDRKLALKEKFLMRIHLLACKPCVRYLDQSEFLSRAVKLLDSKETEALFEGKLSDATRMRIKDALRSSI